MSVHGNIIWSNAFSIAFLFFILLKWSLKQMEWLFSISYDETQMPVKTLSFKMYIYIKKKKIKPGEKFHWFSLILRNNVL